MIVGIDLGTTNSLAAVFRDGTSELIPNALGETMTPSAVHMDAAGTLSVGRAAKERLALEPEHAAARFKRLMGTEASVRLGERSFRAEELSSFVLGSLKADVEAALGTPVSEAIISVPAYFNDKQRKATIAAARLAGLEVRRLVNEPTAAALAYGVLDREAENTFLVVDLGGGTFDVSILEMFSGVMEVRASAGDAFLGGEDFTDVIAAEFLRQLGVEREAMGAHDLARVRAVADRAKHQLSHEMRVTVPFRTEARKSRGLLRGAAVEEGEAALSISRAEFEALAAPLVQRLRVPIQRAIQDANLNPSDIDRIFLVGGATRMEVVRTSVTRLFNRFPDHGLDPDRVVALGAAVQAGLVGRDAALNEMVMTDVSPFTLGHQISQMRGDGKREHGLFAPMIERNTVIPASRSHRVYKIEKDQRAIRLDIYQGESPFVKDNVKIGTYRVPLPPEDDHAEPGLDVRFTYDNSGVLEVEATVAATGEVSRLIVESQPGALTKEEIDERFKALAAIKRHPRDEEEAQALMARLSNAYANALGAERQRISRLIVDFQAVLDSYDRRAIEAQKAAVASALQRLENNDFFR